MSTTNDNTQNNNNTNNASAQARRPPYLILVINFVVPNGEMDQESFEAAARAFLGEAFDPQNGGHKQQRAAKSSLMSELSHKVFSKKDEEEGLNSCAVCQEEYQEGCEVVEAPCGHLFHENCLQPWFQSHNSCPMCRYEVETDDEVYNAELRAKQQLPPLMKRKAELLAQQRQQQQQQQPAHDHWHCDMPQILHNNCVLSIGEDPSIVRLPCEHSFHHACLSSYQGIRGAVPGLVVCPVCRSRHQMDLSKESWFSSPAALPAASAESRPNPESAPAPTHLEEDVAMGSTEEEIDGELPRKISRPESL